MNVDYHNNNSGIWGHSSPSGSEEYIIFASSLNPSEVMEFLADNRISFKPLLGSYKGQTETAYIVNMKVFDTILDAGICNGEESYLHLGKANARDQRPCALIFFEDPSDPVDLGLFQSVTYDYAVKQDAYTYDPYLDKYFVAE